MQTFSWYWRRLRAMTPAEVLWRIESRAQDTWGALRESAIRKRAEERGPALARSFRAQKRVPLLCAAVTGDGGASLPCVDRDTLLERANEVCAGRLALMGGLVCELGDPPRWNFDPHHNRATPMGYAPRIDYRDVRESGDCKWVWEASRHAHLGLLGRAYRTSGDLKYAEAAWRHWAGWLDQCPYCRGMQWRSPLELGIRLINWTFAFEMMGDAPAFDAGATARILSSVELHLHEVASRFSRGSSANNHLVGEAAGVFIAGSYFAAAPEWTRLVDRARAILEAQIALQTLPDGGNVERATGYHTFTLQFFLLSALAARRAGRDFSPAYWGHLRRSFEYLAALAEAGGPLPMFNDADDGYVVDVANDPRAATPWLSVGAALFDDVAMLRGADEQWEPAAWLLGTGGVETLRQLTQRAPQRDKLTARAFECTGHYLLQSGERGEDAISVVIDCAPLGFGSIAAHGHADALSFTLRAFGVEFLCDPGTYDYFSERAWRDYLRSTAAHNTICMDGEDQSECLGLFLWGRRAQSRCIEWQPSAAGGRFVGEHDGYQRLKNPVTHRRTIDLDARAGVLQVIDELRCTGAHRVAQHWHVSEHCNVRATDFGGFELDGGAGIVRIEMDTTLRTSMVRGDAATYAGWVSRGYHRKSSSVSLAAEGEIRGDAVFRTRIEIVRTGPAAPRERIERRASLAGIEGHAAS
ncbi:MAG: alginate lyase family protein [Phycisphaerae bacterium]|nr:alginate lyase family protein [Phycisphaerae bacterium]